MKLVITPDFNKIAPFFYSISHIIENVTAGRETDPNFHDVIADLYYIVLDSTGILLMSRSATDEKLVIEANNLRLLENALYMASETHELDDLQLQSGNIEYRTTYRKELNDMLYDLGLESVSHTEMWYCSGDVMKLDILFTLDHKKIDLCMHKIYNYIRNDIVWGNDEIYKLMS